MTCPVREKRNADDNNKSRITTVSRSEATSAATAKATTANTKNNKNHHNDHTNCKNRSYGKAKNN